MKNLFLILTIYLSFFQLAHAAIEPRGPFILETKPTQRPEAEPKANPQISKSKPAQKPVAQDSGKLIVVTLADQTLKYFQDATLVGEFKISSGLPKTPTPPGEYKVLFKKPVVDYKGVDYDFPRTKWNLEFKLHRGGNYYIHGAYWHHNFGQPMSHGCINVAYSDMEALYNWADVGTKIIIQ